MAPPTVMDQKLNALFVELDRTYETGNVNVDELERLVSEIRRETSVPVFAQQVRRKHGISPAPKDASYRSPGGIAS